MKLEHLKLKFFQQGHLLTAAVIWSNVGLMLILKAVLRFPEDYAQIDVKILFTTLILVAGTLKSYLVLDRAAQKNIDRIHGFMEPCFIGNVYPLPLWGVVFAMIVFGVILKYSPLPTILLSFMYGTIGWSLLFSSRYNWRAWYQSFQ